MGRQKYFIEVDGETYSLNGWAIMNGVNHATALKRYQSGIRDPHALVGEAVRFPTKVRLTDEEKDWLRDISQFSEGQPDHWKIMCDFAGVPYTQKDWLKEQLGEV